MKVRFGDKVIGDGEPCSITYEAGPTHSGVESAKRLIKYAADAGADSIKFHLTDPNRIISDKKAQFAYDILIDRETGATRRVEESLYDIICRRVLTTDEWIKVKGYADSVNLAFFATAVFEDQVDFLVKLGCDSIKIASNDVKHYPLIRKVARTGLCVQLDTGNATIGEIERAVDIVLNEGNNNIIIHHCPHGYPAKPEDINLNVIKSLKALFPFPIAFSDHSPGYVMDVVAVAFGANLVEKTITEDRTTRSPEHIFSLEPEEMAAFVRIIRDVEKAMGGFRRIFSDLDEMGRRRRLRRGAYLAQECNAGTRLKEAKVEFRRPSGNGIEPDIYELMLDAILRKDKKEGEMVLLSDLTWRD
jgi:sialic acid synthase SpsE